MWFRRDTARCHFVVVLLVLCSGCKSVSRINLLMFTQTPNPIPPRMGLRLHSIVHTIGINNRRYNSLLYCARVRKLNDSEKPIGRKILLHTGWVYLFRVRVGAVLPQRCSAVAVVFKCNSTVLTYIHSFTYSPQRK
jgi:hypothetical protein